MSTFCSRALLLEGGRIIMNDSGSNITARYLDVATHTAADGAFG